MSTSLRSTKAEVAKDSRLDHAVYRKLNRELPMPRPVLVVEDDTDCRIMVATLLTVHGYQVVTASNGAERLTVADAIIPASYCSTT